MAKRKRLDPPKGDYLTDRAPGPGPFAAPPLSAPPIAGVAGDAAATAAAAELAQTLTDARAQGRMVVTLELDQIDADYLVRDRVGVKSDDMDTLIASLRARGQQTPIEVVDKGAGATPRYGLLSGWRRLHALSRIAAETDDTDDTGRVLALLRSPADVGDAYLSMVEENEIRVNLSYYERARIALKAVEKEAFPTTKQALLALFHAASRAKRSKIRSFLPVVDALDGVVTFPEEIGERLGLKLSKAIEADPGLKPRLRLALDNALAADAATERQVIEDVLQGADLPQPAYTDSDGFQDDLPTRFDICTGIHMKINARGQITLSGDRVTPALRVDLIDWLYRKGKGMPE